MNQHLKVSRLRLAAAFAIASAALVACGGGGDGYYAPAPVTPTPPTVPASAGVSIAAFIAYVGGLTNSETAEPVLLGSLVPPTDETSAPTALP